MANIEWYTRRLELGLCCCTEFIRTVSGPLELNHRGGRVVYRGLGLTEMIDRRVIIDEDPGSHGFVQFQEKGSVLYGQEDQR